MSYEPLKWACERLQNELPVIRQAPLVFFLTVLSASIIIFVFLFYGFKFYYSAQGERIVVWQEKAEGYEKLFPGKTAEEVAKRLETLENQLEPILNPKIREVKRESKTNPDGTYSVIITLDVYTRPMPPKIRIVAASESLISLRLINGTYNRREGKDKNERPLMLIEFDPPLGEFDIEVKTEKISAFDIEYGF